MRVIIFMFSYSESIAHFKGGISYKVQKVFIWWYSSSCFSNSISLITAQPAYAAGGNVFDENGRPIVGMWVEVQGGRSGWAELRGSGSNRTWYYDTQGKPYQVHVGVGGTPQRWDSNIKSGWNYNQGRSVQVNTIYHYRFGNQINVSPRN